MDKLTKTITDLIPTLLGNPAACLPYSGTNLLVGTAFACGQSCKGGQGCPVNLSIQQISTSLPDVTGSPVLNIDVSFGIDLPIDIGFDPIIGSTSSCTIDFKNSDPLHISVGVTLSTDPTTGYLTINLSTLDVTNLNLGDTSGCGFLGSVASAVVGAVGDLLDALPAQFRQAILGLLRDPINSVIQGILPNPPGIAGALDTSTLLGSFGAPKDANLELFVAAGGYVASKAGGLTLGVMSGLNSDRDPTTRAPGMSSEPSLCVPTRSTPDLATPPWSLPFNAARNDFTLNAAGEFSGNPEPTDANGNLRDVAIGISRTFLDLAGFHIYNGGTLCLSISGASIAQLNSGTLSVIVGSLGSIIEDTKAPLYLVVRPQVPLTFTLGAGTDTDPLLHVALSDARLDFYVWSEERYVRLLTLALDLNLGLNLTSTKDDAGMPAIQLTLSGLEAKNVTLRVSNTDLLSEDPKALEKVFPAILNIATSALGGALKPITLPSVSGFALDEIDLKRVQTTQDDFLGIFATLKTGTPAGFMDWSDPQHGKLVGPLTTRVQLLRTDVPAPEVLKALFASDADNLARIEMRPRVTLRLDADGANGNPVEWAYRVNGGFWHDWTRQQDLVLADDAFLLQGHHTIEVRSRVVNQWATESAPVAVHALIDSVPPVVKPALDEHDPSRIAFHGSDIVSEDSALTYAWLDENGKQTAFGAADGISLEAARLATHDGQLPLTILARDEAGNQSSTPVDVSLFADFHGRTTAPASGGCGCDLGGASRGDGGFTAGLVVLFAAGLVLLRRQKRKATQLAALLAVGAIGLAAGGCNHSGSSLQCSFDDECAKMTCATGSIPQCQDSMCLCSPDLDPGATGRFASMSLLGPTAYVAAYNTTYGDLMIGHVTPPGVITDWDFVDGVPIDEPPLYSNSHVRGGISSEGDDVGRYTSIAIAPTNEPVIAYYDVTHGALKFASFGAVRWHSHTVDKGTGTPKTGDDLGRWAQLSYGTDGKPGIAYYASVKSGKDSMMPETQLRWAQAKVSDPQGPEDWTVTILDSRIMPLPDTGDDADGGVPDGGSSSSDAPADVLLPEAIAIMPAVARKKDGSPAIVYYDRTRGNLRYVEYIGAQGQWGLPSILDGETADGTDTGDVGLYPSIAFDEQDVGHVSYEDATNDNLVYLNLSNHTPEIVDDGYRPMDEETLDGLPSPVYHVVGDSSSIGVTSGAVVIAYQDSTVLQLRFAQRGADGKWQTSTVAGHASPFKGSYGFYANLRLSSGHGIISSYAINQQAEIPLYYVEVFAVDLGLIM